MKKPFAVLLLFSSLALAGEFQVSSCLGKTYGNTGQMLSEPVSVRVLHSSDCTPAAVVPVNFVVQSGDAEINPHPGYLTMRQDGLSGYVVYTDSSGIARINLSSARTGGVPRHRRRREAGATFEGYDHPCFDQFVLHHFPGWPALAIFLMGMQMMSTNLQQAAGNQMKTILQRITSNRLTGIATGALVTAAIQTSSATTVITVGFVNSALMTLQQAVGVDLGANIGTTITGELIAFKITNYAFPMIALGFALSILGRHRTHKLWGKVIVGLGLLLLGMSVMSDVMKPLRSSAPVRDFFADFGRNPILAIFAGTIMTVLSRVRAPQSA